MERHYEASHPWLTFNASSINNLGQKFWILIGEAQSKCRHLAGTPLRPDVAARLSEVALIRGVLATTAIEGNTLTEEQVGGIFAGTFKAPESRAYQETEVKNLIELINKIDYLIGKGDQVTIDSILICVFNGVILENLELDESTIPGEIRKHKVAVSNYRGAPPEDCEYLLDELCTWLEGPYFKSDDNDMQFALLIISAIVAHLYLAWIHPFGDGNGRTARIIEYLILTRSGLIPRPATHLLSNHYNLTRDRYYRELDHASRSGGNINQFLEYALQGFVDGLRDEIGEVREQHLEVAWKNYVHDQMEALPQGKTCDRQRTLVLAMPVGTVVAREALELINPEVARLYAVKGQRTLSRDLNRLVVMGLIRKESGGYIANTAVMEAFLPTVGDSKDGSALAWIHEPHSDGDRATA